MVFLWPYHISHFVPPLPDLQLHRELIFLEISFLRNAEHVQLDFISSDTKYKASKKPLSKNEILPHNSYLTVPHFQKCRNRFTEFGSIYPIRDVCRLGDLPSSISIIKPTHRSRAQPPLVNDYIGLPSIIHAQRGTFISIDIFVS